MNYTLTEAFASLRWAAAGEFSARITPTQAEQLLLEYKILRERVEALESETAVTYDPVVLGLDEYEAVNLKEALLTLRALGLDTGDWLSRIHYKIPEVDQKPNVSMDDQLIRARSIIRARDMVTEQDVDL